MKIVYGRNGREYKVSNDYHNNSLEFACFIEDEGLDGLEVLRILLDWHGTALTSKSMMIDLFEFRYGFEIKEGGWHANDIILTDEDD